MKKLENMPPDKEPTGKWNPCMTCGACCACFRVSFYWAEADEAEGGTIPAAMAVRLNDFRWAMLGTEKRQKRCVALQGQIGKHVSCGIYDRRPSQCREFRVSWEDGIRNAMCDRARATYGMQSFSGGV